METNKKCIWYTSFEKVAAKNKTLVSFAAAPQFLDCLKQAIVAPFALSLSSFLLTCCPVQT